MKKLIIVGAGGLGKEVGWIVDRINQKKKTWDLLGFLDDNESLYNKQIYKKKKVIGTIKSISTFKGVYVACAIGIPLKRQLVIRDILLLNPNIKFAKIIDPMCSISNDLKIDFGAIVFPGAIITVNITIGKYALIGANSTIGHDSNLGDFVSLFPGSNISGNVKICDCVEIGTGSHVIQGKTIGKNSIIGAGAVVINNVLDNSVSVGVPSHQIIKNK
jgi:sugar O-acyltransferase (sialic acid O-acetyltransferase NeuD family)